MEERQSTEKENKELHREIMTVSEKVCLNYAYALAVLKVLHLDVPVVFDSPYGVLDLVMRDMVCAFLEKQSCQQILLGIESEFQEKNKPQYRLDNEGNN